MEPADDADAFENPECARAWQEEIRRRLDDIDSEKTQLLPGEEVLREVDELLT